MIIKKVKFNITQLVAAECFLGCHRKVWDPKINFFLLGRRYNHDVFDLNHTRLILRSTMNCLIEMFNKKCHLWFISNNFPEFLRIKELTSIKTVLSNQITFKVNPWLGGSLSNFKYSPHDIANTLFPHVIFTADSLDNFPVINEAYSIKVPSFSLVDSNSSPSLSFFPIPSNTKGFRPIFLFSLLAAKAVFYSRSVIAGKFLFASFLKCKKLGNFKAYSKSSFATNSQFLQIVNFFIANFLTTSPLGGKSQALGNINNNFVNFNLHNLAIEIPLFHIFNFFKNF